MTLFIAGSAFGAVLAGLLAWYLSGAVLRQRIAGLNAERDLLRERVTDLEGTIGQDQELAATMAPLSSALQRVERQVQALERDRVEQFSRLDEQLNAVRRGEEALRVQTAALAGALRSPTARGAWGEIQLRRVVEHAGMLARVDFSTQVTGTTPDGATVRPDLVVHLPGGKHLVVDAKAPLAAFLEASELATAGSAEGVLAGPQAARVQAERQERAAVLHAKALRAHVDSLAAKEYWTAFQPTPQLVVCFVPGEAFLAAACSADPALLDHAMGRRVVLATPTTLLALLRTIALTWQSEALTGNARQLFDLGRELHTRLGSLGDSTSRLGRTLQRAVEDYNSMVATLERRVLVTARRMESLDITDGQLEIPQAAEVAPRPLTAPELVEPWAEPLVDR